MTEQDAAPDRVIVVGVDGSAAGKAALRWAIREATQRHAVVRAVSVRYGSELTPAASMERLPHDHTRPEVDPEQHQHWLAKQIDDARAEIPDAAPVVGVPVIGDPTLELTKESADAELVVVGSHGYGPLAETFLGSVAGGTIRHARCPVVVIAGNAVQRSG
jgi:nucleotide-binding universal stress UspA family protein